MNSFTPYVCPFCSLELPFATLYGKHVVACRKRPRVVTVPPTPAEFEARKVLLQARRTSA